MTTSTREKEANLIASALLMPEDLLRAEASRLDLEEEADIALLARTFSVSDQAMSIGLLQLGLLKAASF